MRIGIDGRIFLKPGSGTVRYAYDLMHALLKVDKEDEYIIYVPGNAKEIEKLNVFKGNVKIKIVRGMPPILWRTPLFTSMLDKDKVDVYHSMAYIVPFVPKSMRRVSIVCTSQGMLTEFPNVKEEYYWKPNYWAAAKFSNRIMAVAKQLADEIHERYGTPYDIIDVTMTGVSDAFQYVPHEEREAKRKYIYEKYKLGSDGYLIYVGAGMAPNKNVSTILKAWKILMEKHGFKLPIAITRVDMSILSKEIESLGLKPNVDVIGMKWMDEQDIPYLYACAEATVYGTVYEGFGTVIVESQAIGTPVIISNVSAMPEAAGDAALKVNNPKDPEEWASAVIRIHTDKNLRNELVKKGLENVKRFRYDVIARNTIESYKKAMPKG